MLAPRAAASGVTGEESMYAAFSELGRAELTLYTDALVARGSIRTRQHRISDILNLSDAPFLVLEDVTVTDHDGHDEPIRADVAQINLDAVLFAVVNEPVSPSPELRSPKIQREALISIPPFRVTGTLHLLAGSANLREALTDLTGRFLPVTDAEFEAPARGIGRQSALMLAVNHQRAQILARYLQPGDRPGEPPAATQADPWAATPDASAGAPAAGNPWAGTDWSEPGTEPEG
jgi:hypothetical protein